MLIFRRSFAWKTKRWSWPRENGNWRNSLKKTGGKFWFLSLSLFLSFIAIHWLTRSVLPTSSVSFCHGRHRIRRFHAKIILTWEIVLLDITRIKHMAMIKAKREEVSNWKQSNKCCHWIPIVICETLLHFLFQVAFLQSEYESFSVKITSFEGQRVGKLAFPLTNIIFAFKTFLLQILGSGFNLGDTSFSCSSPNIQMSDFPLSTWDEHSCTLV